MEPRQRTSGTQFAVLLEFMESHGDLTKPQAGPQGRNRAALLWEELAHTLNSVGGGVNKTPDKWKKILQPVDTNIIYNEELLPSPPPPLCSPPCPAAVSILPPGMQDPPAATTSPMSSLASLTAVSDDASPPQRRTRNLPRVGARRRRARTPFDRAATEFAAIERRRLRLEEKRERNDARRLEIEKERNVYLGQVVQCLSKFLEGVGPK